MSSESIAGDSLTWKEQREADAKGLSAAAYVRLKYDVDPGNHTTDHSLMEAMSERRKNDEVSDAIPDNSENYSSDLSEYQKNQQRSEADRIAVQCLAASEMRKAAMRDLTAAEFIREEYDLNPSEYQSEEELRADMTRSQSPHNRVSISSMEARSGMHRTDFAPPDSD